MNLAEILAICLFRQTFLQQMHSGWCHCASSVLGPGSRDGCLHNSVLTWFPSLCRLSTQILECFCPVCSHKTLGRGYAHYTGEQTVWEWWSPGYQRKWLVSQKPECPSWFPIPSCTSKWSSDLSSLSTCSSMLTCPNPYFLRVELLAFQDDNWSNQVLCADG